MQKFQLTLETKGYYSDYSLRVNPSTLDAFASAAGLHFYSMLPKTLGTQNRANQSVDEQSISDLIYNPGELYFQDKLDGYLRYLLLRYQLCIKFEII